MASSRLYGVLCAFCAILFASSLEGGRVMNIGARIGCWSGGKNLPYDRRVKWLKGDGAVYFDLGLNPSGKYLKITNDYTLLPYTGGWTGIYFVGYYGWSQSNFSIQFSRDNSGMVPHVNLNAVISGTTTTAKTSPLPGSRNDEELTDILFDSEAGILSSDGTTGSETATFTPFQYQWPTLTIWGYRGAYATMSGTIGIYLDGVLSANLIPCVKDGVGEYYDSVREIFLTKGGTGTITIGPTVNG